MTSNQCVGQLMPHLENQVPREDVKHGELLQELHSRGYFLDADITGYRRLEADGDVAGAQRGRSKPLDSVPSWKPGTGPLPWRWAWPSSSDSNLELRTWSATTLVSGSCYTRPVADFPQYTYVFLLFRRPICSLLVSLSVLLLPFLFPILHLAGLLRCPR